MNKLTLTALIFALAFVGLASALDYSCEPGYNMYSFSPMQATYGGQIFLNSQNVATEPCCETPAYNNHYIPSTVTFNIISLNSQHFVFDDCCSTPIYNNHQIKTKPSSPKMIYLDTFHFSEPCCTI